MKYIKTYENNKKGKVWQINTKMPHFLVILDKIGINKTEIKYWYNVFNKYNKEKDFDIYMNKSYDGKWSWGFVTKHYEPARHFNSVFMGVIDVTDAEVAAFKYNL